jgi:hypothetical protein
MSKFLYTVYLPGVDKHVHLTELSFLEYKQLVKVITNDNNDLIAAALNQIIKDHCLEDVSSCTFLDKLLILLTIRSVCISPVLEIVAKCPDTGSQYNCTTEITDIKNIIESTKLMSYEKQYDAVTIKYTIPKTFFIPRGVEALETVVHSATINNTTTTEIEAIIDRLPANILKDASEFITDTYDALTNCELLKLISPFSPTSTPIIITANVYNGAVLEFLKLCFKRDLMSLYELEFFFTRHLHLNLNDINTQTPAELSIYTGLFNEEQREIDKLNKKSTGIPLQPPV